MTQVWNDKGRVVPVTVVEAGPCIVTQIKSQEKDGYGAVQLGWGVKKHLTKPQRGHLRDLPGVRWLHEFRFYDSCFMIHDSEAKRGDVIDVSVFMSGDAVKVTGVSKGKGFQGVVKRHHFHGSPASHGHKDQLRMPGAIGSGGVQRVFKGTRMGGRMGGERITVSNAKIVGVDKEKNQLMIKGPVPGARGSLVMIQG